MPGAWLVCATWIPRFLQVMNVELLLAALETCGVDNCRIEIEGGHEIPVLDNSALGWCIEVQVSTQQLANTCC
jgi:UDP-3-O-acyl-N-acetylglucosamine deacetylase